MRGQSALFKKIISVYDHIDISAKDLKNVEITVHLKTDSDNSLYTIINVFDENFEELIKL
jgi:hypothetical protein